jgi:hypothetical protein
LANRLGVRCVKHCALECIPRIAILTHMPTVLRIGSFRFHFYSDEGTEPLHIHVRTHDGECKFWLEPIALAAVKGVKPHDIRAIERLVFEHRVVLLAAYHEFHRNR